MDGSLSFDLPVLFVDEGDGFPEGLKVASLTEKLKKDEDEIDLEDEDTNDEDVAGDDAEDEKTPDGLLRIAPNLYQLVGEATRSNVLDSTADIVSVPLPLNDPKAAETEGSKKRDVSTSLTVGFLGPNIRLPCKSFDQKAKHTAFLGCDILISSEWGQGTTGALTKDDRAAVLGEEGGTAAEIGSYDVSELVATSRARYHIAPGMNVPVQVDEAVKLRRRFTQSLPYRYPATSSASGDGHAGRFLAIGSVVTPAEAKSLGKPFKFIHAVGIVPLSFMDANEREAAKEAKAVVECPYTDASYRVDNSISAGEANFNSGGLSEAQARRLAQEHAMSEMGGGGDGAFRWQQRPSRKRPRDGAEGGDSVEAQMQAFEAQNPENRSLFLHGLHRDPAMILNVDVLMEAFRPFGCINIRFPRPRGGRPQHSFKPSYAFLDFNTHDEALNCVTNLNGEAVIRNIMLNIKWSSSPNKRPFQGQPAQPKRQNRLTEAEAADSMTLFVRLPQTMEQSAYGEELETIRLLAQGTMEEELNVGVSLDSPDRITAKDEPGKCNIDDECAFAIVLNVIRHPNTQLVALRVSARHPNTDMNYGFLEFSSHTAALTTAVVLTGNQDGGDLLPDKLVSSCLIADDNSSKKDVSHLTGACMYWAKGSQGEGSSGTKNYGLNLGSKHFPADSRTDCWFCLASPTCEKHLIISVLEEVYITLPKGGVNEYHSLIVPVEHGGDGASVTRKIESEIGSIKTKLRKHARDVLQKDLFIFERSIQTKGGYHPHIQCIPVDAGLGPKIQSKMLEMATRAGFKLKEITGEIPLSSLDDDWSEGYFYAEVPLPGGDEYRRYLYRVADGGGSKSFVPIQFGREVLAEVMDNPDVAQWKACVVSKEREEEWTKQFRESLSDI